VGLGAVLSQLEDGIEYPVTHLSQRLLPHEKNYAIIEKEFLAVKWANLRYYLLDREFMLVTDHAPLKWMANNKDKNARITRWFLHLQDFKFTVEHRAEKLHGNADAKSRRDDCWWSVAPHHGSELRRGICEGLIPDPCPTGLQRHGVVLQGRYYRGCSTPNQGLSLPLPKWGQLRGNQALVLSKGKQRPEKLAWARGQWRPGFSTKPVLGWFGHPGVNTFSLFWITDLTLILLGLTTSRGSPT